MNAILDKSPALVLNADFRPLSYFPLSLWPWQEAVKAVFLGRVSVVSEYEDAIIHSPRLEFRLPSVIALKEYAPTHRRPAFTRFNVFLRDRFTCQYCGCRFPTHDLTFDHVIPRCKGGRTSWTNLSIAGNIVCVCLQWLTDTMYRVTASPYIAKPADTLPMKEVP